MTQRSGDHGAVTRSQGSAAPETSPGAGPETPTVSSSALFGGTREVLIEHAGTCYRLRQTSLGKLILTK